MLFTEIPELSRNTKYTFYKNVNIHFRSISKSIIKKDNVHMSSSELNFI